jgi:uncharacterized protein DUF6929
MRGLYRPAGPLLRPATVARVDAVLRERFRIDAGAASGLVVRDGVAHVIADDGERLRRYRLDGARLPDVPATDGTPEPAIAKPRKPDLEALLDLGDGRLVAFGSGSRPNRERAVLFDPRAGRADPIDLAPLYARVRAELGALDIEGAARWRDAIVLGQRGIGRGRTSALVWLDGTAAPARGAWNAASFRSVAQVALPELEGVPLALTDLAVHPVLGLHFLAAAEATEDAYEDAPCAGSVLGRFDEALRPQVVARLRPDVKAEGLAWWQPPGEPGRWLIVADADDGARESPLYELV